MKFFSTNGNSPIVGFKEAVINSLPSDNGLYFPEYIPQVSADFLASFRTRTLPELAFEMLRTFTSEIDDSSLRKITEEVFDFKIPLVQVEENIFSLELFHGPTYAFKDVGARFLARCFRHFSKDKLQETTILVATSGDTGGAVANGFYGVEGVRVIILYPSGKVSELQEKQLTTLDGNITALEVDGNFDDCQALVKKAFLDKELNAQLQLTSANSINIARWISQSVYYAWALNQLGYSKEVVFSVPSGNYGNITAGMLAKKMGFPIGRYLACSNANDVVPRYLSDEQFDPKPTITTYANAMDVSLPSNFPRMLEIHGGSYDSIKQDIQGFSLGDEQILETIKQCWGANHYMLDPHGAIAYAGLKTLLRPTETGVFLETAHPIKFEPTMKLALDTIEFPTFATELMGRTKKSIKMKVDFETFKSVILA